MLAAARDRWTSLRALGYSPATCARFLAVDVAMWPLDRVRDALGPPC